MNPNKNCQRGILFQVFLLPYMLLFLSQKYGKMQKSSTFITFSQYVCYHTCYCFYTPNIMKFTVLRKVWIPDRSDTIIFLVYNPPRKLKYFHIYKFLGVFPNRISNFHAIYRNPSLSWLLYPQEPQGRLSRHSWSAWQSAWQSVWQSV